MKLDQALSELQRLGMHLDPGAAAAAKRARRVRLNTRTYPFMRALGFHLLMAGVVFHNAMRFGTVGWPPVLVLIAVTEVYVLLSWLAVRRWFLRVPRIAGWDLSDLFFLADLVLWAAAIHVTGGPRSLLWLVPLLRVADHHAVRKVWAFAHLAPVAYLAGAAWGGSDALPQAPAASPVGWEGHALKMVLLYVAGLYIAFTGLPAQRFRAQREAALSAAAALLARLSERTQSLDDVKRSKGALLDRLDTGIRTTLVEIVGFAQFLLRSGAEAERPRSERRMLERIHEDSRSLLRTLDDLARGPAVPDWPHVSVAAILRRAAEEESRQGDEPQPPARLLLPPMDAQLPADASRLESLFRHLIAAGRHFQEDAPSLELQLDEATSLPEAVVMTCRVRATIGGSDEDLFNPFAESIAGNQLEMGARLELSMARAISQSMGFDMDLTAGPARSVVTVRLR